MLGVELFLREPSGQSARNRKSNARQRRTDERDEAKRKTENQPRHTTLAATRSPFLMSMAARGRGFAQKKQTRGRKQTVREVNDAENARMMERVQTQRTEINITERAAAYSVLDEIVIADDDIFGRIGIVRRHACASWRTGKCARQ
jgi:hypothetical protein